MIVSGDFHISTQMVGADTSEFFPALEDAKEGYRISSAWSATARRLNDEFAVSVGFVSGKRCLGGMLELLMHCHYLVAVEDAQLGMPEVTLPVVPGMEGCHWPFRKSKSDDWPKIARMLLTGRAARATDAAGWLVDFAGPLDQAIQTAWKLASGSDHGLQRRTAEAGALKDATTEGDLPAADSPGMEAARRAILECVQQACALPLSEALAVQAKRSADFLASATCREGQIGAEYTRTMSV